MGSRRIVVVGGGNAALCAAVSASERGRMGVAHSIRGRVEDLGGAATWSTRPGGGCVVRMSVPRSRDTGPGTGPRAGRRRVARTSTEELP